MSDINMGKLGVVAPFKAKEGTITITKDSSGHGSRKVPVHSAPLSQGMFVELDGEMTVKPLTTTGVLLGIVFTETGKWIKGVDPVTNRTQAQAISADELREWGIETIFKKILTVDVTGTVNAGDYLVPDDSTAGKFEQSASSGATASNYIALTAKDSDNKAVVGFI